ASSTIGQWTQFTYNVTPGNTTVATLELINQNIATGGNDFALDDISIRQVSAVTSSVSLTVNPTVAVNVSISASINPLYSGGSVTFTAAPVNGGSSPTYQWKVNTINAGTNSSTYTYIPATGDNITCVMTSNAPCPTGNPATSNQLTALTRSNFWRGTNSTDWGTASNWTAGYIPIPGNDVVYASSSNDWGSDAINDLVLDQNRTIGNLTNVTAKALIIPANLGLVVNNTIQTDGVADRIYIKSSTTVANGSLLFIHPELNSSVNASVEMYSKASWSLTPADSIAQTRYKWQYFGIPLTSIVANPFFYGAYVRGWHEDGTSISNHWISLTNDSILRPFYGYELCQDAPTTYVFQGTLVNSNFSSGQLAYTGTALFPGQQIFANPYTAAIDIRQLTFGAGAQEIVYLYNTGTYGAWSAIAGVTSDGSVINAGQYIAVPKSQAGNSFLPRQIPSMGAMLIRPLTTSSVNYNFSINYNSVAMINTLAQRAPSVEGISSNDKVSIIIDVKGAHAADRMWIFTEPNCTRDFDNGWDGQKMLGSALSPQLYAIEADGNYQVNSVPDMNGTELGFQAGQDIEDTLTFTHQNLEKRYAGVYLIDLVENKTVDITVSGTQYAFMAESTPAPVKRFRIVTRPYEKDASDAESLVKIFSSENSIIVQNFGDLNGECRVYDIAGHYLMKVPFVANAVTAVSNSLKPGAYVATAISGGEKVSKRLIVR
ncbi:MAG: T9SS type A sorting domain-containing protein, partial [Paludibacter sp.]